jgi:hypothetical protein
VLSYKCRLCCPLEGEDDYE